MATFLTEGARGEEQKVKGGNVEYFDPDEEASPELTGNERWELRKSLNRDVKALRETY